MNLTQTQNEAKNAYLNEQQEMMLALYKNAATSERIAVIKQIDSFVSVVPPDMKTFWLEFRRKLETLNEKKVLFPLGDVYLTIGAKEALEESNQLPNDFLEKHQAGNYGDICKDDWKENELAVKEGFRILSAYKTNEGTKIWVITEADRSSTSLILPSEY